MLKVLEIEKIAVLENAAVQFDPRLNVLPG